MATAVLLCYAFAFLFALLGAFGVPGRVDWLALAVALAILPTLLTTGDQVL